MASPFSKVVAPSFECFICDYTTRRKNDYNKHVLTSKHLIAIQKCDKAICLSHKVATSYLCNCGKEYKHDSSYYRHKKSCKQESSNVENIVISEQNEVIQPNTTTIDHSALIMELLKQNNEFKELIIEQNKQMIEMASKAGNTTNNNNNTTNNNQQFNLHIFLNEKCKNAMNITDFVDTIKVQLTDLEAFGTHGYCEGITRVFMRYLNELDICKRPIHCSDLKREIMYVKDKDAWEKDDERKLIKKAIDKIERKNHLTIPAWQVANPEFNDYNSKVNDVYNKMLIEAMGGETKEENDKNYSKITRCIAKGTIITKNHM